MLFPQRSPFSVCGVSRLSDACLLGMVTMPRSSTITRPGREHALPFWWYTHRCSARGSPRCPALTPPCRLVVTQAWGPARAVWDSGADPNMRRHFRSSSWLWAGWKEKSGGFPC